VIDTATHPPSVVATIPETSGVAVAVTPDGKHAYVANGASNTVSVIRTATNMVVATVPVGTISD
jgi:YVTN family beta-propeller protein